MRFLKITNELVGWMLEILFGNKAVSKMSG